MSALLTHWETGHHVPQHLLVLDRNEASSLLAVVEAAIEGGGFPRNHQLHDIAASLRDAEARGLR